MDSAPQAHSLDDSTTIDPQLLSTLSRLSPSMLSSLRTGQLDAFPAADMNFSGASASAPQVDSFFTGNRNEAMFSASQPQQQMSQSHSDLASRLQQFLQQRLSNLAGVADPAFGNQQQVSTMTYQTMPNGRMSSMESYGYDMGAHPASFVGSASSAVSQFASAAQHYSAHPSSYHQMHADRFNSHLQHQQQQQQQPSMPLAYSSRSGAPGYWSSSAYSQQCQGGYWSSQFPQQEHSPPQRGRHMMGGQHHHHSRGMLSRKMISETAAPILPRERDNNMDQAFCQPSRQIFVGNVSASTNEKDLERAFSSFGEMESVKCYSHLRFAFVVFRELRSAILAKETCYHSAPTIRGRIVIVNYGKQMDDDGSGNGSATGTDSHNGSPGGQYSTISVSSSSPSSILESHLASVSPELSPSQQQRMLYQQLQQQTSNVSTPAMNSPNTSNSSPLLSRRSDFATGGRMDNGSWTSSIKPHQSSLPSQDGHFFGNSGNELDDMSSSWSQQPQQQPQQQLTALMDAQQLQQLQQQMQQQQMARSYNGGYPDVCSDFIPSLQF